VVAIINYQGNYQDSHVNSHLPYGAVTTLDLMQDQSVIFHFGDAASSNVTVPEASVHALMGLGIFGLGLSRRKMKK
jgi:hypothetical protein